MQVTHENGDIYTLFPYVAHPGISSDYNIHTERDRKRGVYAPTQIYKMIGVPEEARPQSGFLYPRREN